MTRLLLISLAAAVVAACTDQIPVAPPPPPSGPPPQDGELTLTLVSENADDGAVFFELRGPSIKSAVAANASLQLFTEIGSDTLLRAVVVGGLNNSALLMVKIQPGYLPSRYQAQVIDVADTQGQLRTTLSGYSVTVTGQ